MLWSRRQDPSRLQPQPSRKLQPNRLRRSTVSREDFDNDQKDVGEIGAGNHADWKNMIERAKASTVGDSYRLECVQMMRSAARLFVPTNRN